MSIAIGTIRHGKNSMPATHTFDEGFSTRRNCLPFRPAPFEQAGNRNILIERRPVNANTPPNQAPGLALFRARATQFGKPGERHADFPRIGEANAESIDFKPDVRRHDVRSLSAQFFEKFLGREHLVFPASFQQRSEFRI